jgi:hypothetical protein
MAYQASALSNNNSFSLSSVKSWGTNMNIVKDPPKSITTRQRVKVGDNECLNGEQNRTVEENIKTYARSVNPFVSVSYSNNGKGGSGSAAQASLPYKTAIHGDFRPKVLSMDESRALSRQKYNTILDVNSNKNIIDGSKKIVHAYEGEDATKYREIIDNKIEYNAYSNFKSDHEKLKQYNYVQKGKFDNSVKDVVIISAKSGNKTKEHKDTYKIPVSTNHNMKDVFFFNPKQNFKNPFSKDSTATIKYTENHLSNKPNVINVFASKNSSYIDQHKLINNSVAKLKVIPEVSYNTNKISSDYTKHMEEKEMHLKKKTPAHALVSSKTHSNEKYKDNIRHEYKFKPTNRTLANRRNTHTGTNITRIDPAKVENRVAKIKDTFTNFGSYQTKPTRFSK